MSILDEIKARARLNPGKVGFSEATEEKMLEAIRMAVDEGICLPVLLGNPDEIRKAASEYDISLDGMEIVDAFDEAFLEELIGEYVKGHPLNSVKTMKRLAADPLYTALMMEDLGRTRFTLGGFAHTSTEFQMAALTVIGMKEGMDTMFSACLMDVPNYSHGEGGRFFLGDCVVCANPDAKQLAGIAIETCERARSLLGWEPRCALLSYATGDSGAGELVDKVREAVVIAKDKRPDLAIDGPLQFDSALDPKVAAKKVKWESEVAGQANILLLPNLDVGNILIKALQAFAGLDGYLVMMGTAKPVGDVSRNSPITEIVGNIAMGAIAQGGE